mgnify:CR=1 FL=1
MKLIVKSIILLALIFGLSYYNYISHGKEYREGLKKQEVWKLAGLKVISINNNVVYAKNEKDQVYLINYENNIHNADSLNIYDLVSVKGKHLDGDTLSAELIHIHKNRSFKIYFSLIPFFTVVFLFFKYFKFNLKTFKFSRK